MSTGVIGAIVGVVGSAILALVGWIVSRGENRDDDLNKLRTRVHSTEQRLNNMDVEIERIEEKIDRLDQNQTEMKEELSRRLSDLREDQARSHQDIKWIKQHLEEESDE